MFMFLLSFAEKENTSKVNIFLTGDRGISVLHDAVMNDHVDVARILLQYGGLFIDCQITAQ